jgi:hypothetical protein
MNGMVMPILSNWDSVLPTASHDASQYIKNDLSNLESRGLVQLKELTWVVRMHILMPHPPLV